jgi:hypothetical protein
MKVFILCFCALLAVSHGRLRESESRRTLQQDDTSDGEEMMNVIVKYKDTVNRSSARYPMGGILKKRYHRVNAAAFSIPLSEMSALQNDPDVEYVEEDQMLYRSAFESVGYQIPAVQANTTRIPLPDPSADCFNICVIDSGLLIGHPDIVSLQNCSGTDSSGDNLFIFTLLLSGGDGDVLKPFDSRQYALLFFYSRIPSSKGTFAAPNSDSMLESFGSILLTATELM